jgi:hypothetical protein
MAQPSFLDALLDTQTSHYSISGTTGSIMASAATKLIWYCRYTGTAAAIIRRVSIDGVIATTAFAVGQLLYTLSIARAFSAENVTPGGTALTITKPNQLLRDGEAATGMGVVRISSTAALAAPTWTLDSNPVAQINSHSSGGLSIGTTIIGSQYLPRDGVLWNADQMNDFPIVLGNNEGLAIQVAVPATGVWIAGVTMEWDEPAAVLF